MNLQREKFYAQRRRVLEGENLSEDILYMIDCEVERMIKSYVAPGMNPEEYQEDDIKNLIRELYSLTPQLSGQIKPEDIKNLRYENIYEKIKDAVTDAYKSHEVQIVDFYNDIISKYEDDFVPQVPFAADNVMRSLERDILLRVIDNKWIDHLHNNDMLREGIGLRAYGQKDPLIEYKKEAYDMFNKMMFEIQSETVMHLFRSKFGIQIVNPSAPPDIFENAQENIVEENESEEISPDAYCPCGSGKKYKNCCGKRRRV